MKPIKLLNVNPKPHLDKCNLPWNRWKKISASFYPVANSNSQRFTQISSFLVIYVTLRDYFIFSVTFRTCYTIKFQVGRSINVELNSYSCIIFFNACLDLVGCPITEQVGLETQMFQSLEVDSKTFQIRCT